MSAHGAITDRSAFWQPGWWMANVWLLFLVFPVMSLVVDDDLTTARKAAGVGALALFALTHALGYRALVERELGLAPRRSTSVDPATWFAAMVLLQLASVAIAGWGAIGALPFIVTFAVFNFSWRTAGLVAAACLGVSVAVPLVLDALDELWWFPVVIISATAATMLIRTTEERAHDVTALQTQLAVSEERARLARDVHDVLGHSLTAIVLKTQVTDRVLAAIDDPTPEVAAARQQLAETQNVSRKALAEIRATVSGMRSAELADELAAARSVLSDAGVSLVVTGDPSSVPHRHHQALGWTVREAVTNIVRHAGASSCTIELDGGPSLLTVRDDGVGIDGAREGNGLTGLRERLADAELALAVEPRRNGSSGTTVTVATA